MNTVVVWILVLITDYYGAHFTVVDNIASEANCRALARELTSDAEPQRWVSTKCLAVRKVRP